MSTKTRSVLSIAAATIIALWAGASSSEEADSIPIARASEQQIELAATQALATGQTTLALQLAEVLLLRDPSNALAHFIVGQITLRAGDTGTARIAARKSFHDAGSSRQRYEAARLAGQVAVADKRWMAAQYWARQTIQFAPDPLRREIGVQDFRKLRAISPLAWSFTLGVKPSNNVNGGADERTNVIDGFDTIGILSADAVALRGVAATGDLDLSWRVASGPHSETRLGVTGYSRMVELAGHPKRIPLYTPGLPEPEPEEIPNSEFSSAAFGVTASHVRSLSPTLTLGLTGEAGRNWQGGDPAYDYVSAGAHGASALGGERQFTYGVDYEHRDWVNSARLDNRHGISVGYAQPLGRGQVRFSGFLSQLDSNNSQARSWSVTGAARYTPDWQLGPFSMTFSAGLSKTVYPDYSILWLHPDGGRQDNATFAEIGLWAPALGVAAFAPEIKLQAVTVDSNVSRFSRHELSVALGWRSSF